MNSFISNGAAALLLLGALTTALPSDISLIQKRALSPASGLSSGFKSIGCYLDSPSRTLAAAAYDDQNAMTGESCVSFCNGKGYIYAGTEYTYECFCGNYFSQNTTEPASDCSTACAGNATQSCGGPNRLNVYWNGTAPPSMPEHNPGSGGWSELGCYTEGTNGRVLTTTMSVPGGNSAMTVDLCTSACKSGGYKYAGVEYADECYCGNTFSNGGGPAANGYSDCNMLCAGNSTEYCGAGNRLDMYAYGSAAEVSASSTASATGKTSSGVATSTKVSRSTSSTSAAATGLPSGWKYAGCYVDNVYGRDMAYGQPDNSTLTVQSCIETCQGLGYVVAGMEYSVQCFCDNYLGNGAALASTDTDCNMACGGNANEECGAGNRLSVYNTNGTLTTYGVPKTQTTNLPGAWEYQGCLADNVNNERTMFWQIILTNNNTADSCLGLCQQYGYNAAGVEYGEECYCGDIAAVAAGPATMQSESACSITCSGNPETLCGGNNVLSYYTWGGDTPLYTWNTPTGNAAGAYEFLIGGVVVPLISTPAINGKVTFQEKSGTGAPNTTGAYELDLTEINNFTAAWRPMHVKTDIFCSSGLTLPDKVGRQITVGGWSGTSTYGIRIYWPDGSPGIPGTNDWQENVDEVSLQNGRWYPSAMVMSNGSILVVGGEDGSNGAPVPTLEILPNPKPGTNTTKYLSWLQRTDPNNLYPFLSVLPSGGIFVAYWNEARILDPVSLETIKTLPNIPGTVASFLAGRTYPLEGTSMLMPQYAPYTDLLTVLICGGSTPYSGWAIDNCVSTQPDADNPSWVLERMPSQRVISCMTALPDGTYLILNGAHQGVAGFGLATSPNLNAVLYDPSKPVNSRMSIMASTIVARLYHSEAVLLQDGRVLVSGSDPEDGVNPEEYRVEVFIPPYLLSGLAKPTYTISQQDWAYGGSYPIKVSLPTGNMANMKISILGSVSSTHGNSMGQRTIFPAYTCSGTTCTITAPPNNNVCPPGWHMLFVLDGPTPSYAQWIRIGGDPASIGNWPNYPDFDVPGTGAAVIPDSGP